MIKLLFDMGAARSTARDLRERGFDAVHVAEIGFASAADERVVERADTEQRVIVSFDLDFARLVVTKGRALPSLILLRIPSLAGPATTRLLFELLPRIESDLLRGCVVSVAESGYRVRPLPLEPIPGPKTQ